MSEAIELKLKDVSKSFSRVDSAEVTNAVTCRYFRLWKVNYLKNDSGSYSSYYRRAYDKWN